MLISRSFDGMKSACLFSRYLIPPVESLQPYSCTKCGLKSTKTNIYIDFSSWEGFGKLFEWCIEQDDKFLWNNPMKLCFLRPDYFADRIYNHLKAKYPLAETIKTADIIT